MDRVVIYVGVSDERNFNISARKFCRVLGNDFPWLHIHLTPTGNSVSAAVLKRRVDCAIFKTLDLPAYLQEGLDYFFLSTSRFAGGIPRDSNFDPLSETDLPERLVILFCAGDQRFQLIRNAYIHPCSIAGAGAGHRADNTTLAVKDEIKAVEIILHDALINPEVLALAGPNCKLIDVGKRFNKKSWAQEDICRAMVNLTRRGYRVLRLKGGSPVIFARLQEEVDALETLALPYYVFPGIDSAAAFSALYGGPLTQRGVSSSVEISNLRPLKGNIKDVTRVFFMGLGALKHNRLPDGITIHDQQPMVAGYNIGGNDEKILQGSSADVIQAMIDQELQPPIIVVTGDAVKNYDRRRYLPLKKLRILITRQSPAMTILARELEKFGAFVVISSSPDETTIKGVNLIILGDKNIRGGRQMVKDILIHYISRQIKQLEPLTELPVAEHRLMLAAASGA